MINAFKRRDAYGSNERCCAKVLLERKSVTETKPFCSRRDRKFGNGCTGEDAKTGQNSHVVFIPIFPPYQIAYGRKIKAIERPAILRHGERLAVHKRRMNFHGRDKERDF